MSGTLSPRVRALASALAAAKHAAQQVQDGEDGGSANFDSPFLYAQRGLAAVIVNQAAEAAGVSIRRARGGMWNGWFVDVVAGQGAMRTRMAEAACQALKQAGEEASVYYQLD